MNNDNDIDGDGDAGSTTTPLLQQKLNYGGQTESGKIVELRDRIVVWPARDVDVWHWPTPTALFEL